MLAAALASPGGHAGAVLAGHRAEPAAGGGRGVDVGVGAATALADTEAARVGRGQLVPEGERRRGRQPLPRVFHQPGFRGLAVG